MHLSLFLFCYKWKENLWKNCLALFKNIQNIIIAYTIWPFILKHGINNPILNKELVKFPPFAKITNGFSRIIQNLMLLWGFDIFNATEWNKDFFPELSMYVECEGIFAERVILFGQPSTNLTGSWKQMSQPIVGCRHKQ